MMPERLFVIVPSLLPTGPVKGAVALCNGLTGRLPVTLVVLKAGRGDELYYQSGTRLLSLAHLKSWRQKRAMLEAELEGAGGRMRVACVSFCLSADAMNFFMRRHAFITASVRGNLPENYRFDYGPLGRVVAWLHLLALHRFDRVVAMSDAMAAQLRRFGLRRLAVIGNFVDEETLAHYRVPSERFDGPVRFLFLASLSRRKRPELLLAAASELAARGLDFRIEIAGTGPLESALREQVQGHGLSACVTFHGQLGQPFDLLQRVDYLVLPSESEGISRAVLEALYFGIPCILRDVDANREVISPGYNGELFRDDCQLAGVMAQAMTETAAYRLHRNLLPPLFRQGTNIKHYLESLSG